MANLLLIRFPMPVKVGSPIGTHASTIPTGGSTEGASTTGTVITPHPGSAGTFLTDGSRRAAYLWVKDGMNISVCSGECGCALPDGAPAELGGAA